MFQDSPVCNFYREVIKDTANSRILWNLPDTVARHLLELRPSSPEALNYFARQSPRLATQALQDQLHASWGDAIVTGTEDEFMYNISDADFHLMFKDLKSQA